MTDLDKIYNKLIEIGTSEQNAVLDALMSVNGFVQGIVDYYAYYYSNNYQRSIEDVENDLFDEEC